MTVETVAKVPEVRNEYDETLDDIKEIGGGAWAVLRSAEGKAATIRSGLNAAAKRAGIRLQHKVRDEGKVLYSRVKPDNAGE